MKYSLFSRPEQFYSLMTTATNESFLLIGILKHSENQVNSTKKNFDFLKNIIMKNVFPQYKRKGQI